MNEDYESSLFNLSFSLVRIPAISVFFCPNCLATDECGFVQMAHYGFDTVAYRDV